VNGRAIRKDQLVSKATEHGFFVIRWSLFESRRQHIDKAPLVGCCRTDSHRLFRGDKADKPMPPSFVPIFSWHVFAAKIHQSRAPNYFRWRVQSLYPAREFGN